VVAVSLTVVAGWLVGRHSAARASTIAFDLGIARQHPAGNERCIDGCKATPLKEWWRRYSGDAMQLNRAGIGLGWFLDVNSVDTIFLNYSARRGQ
jgi:hypothetical protein